jgi:RND family efflux transporter MFP subunit
MSISSISEQSTERMDVSMNDSVVAATNAKINKSRPARSWWKRLLWPVILVVVCGGAGWWYVGHAKKVKPEATVTAAKDVAPVTVTVTPATMRTMERTVGVVGSLYGQEEVTVAPKVEGRVLNVFHDMGDIVKPGELLLKIDDTDFRLAVEEAQRALELELSKLQLKMNQLALIDGPEAEKYILELPAVKRAYALQENAKRVRERYRALPVGARTEEEMERFETEFTVAEANYQQIVLDTKSNVASVRLKAATLETARQKLKDTEMRVPQPLKMQGQQLAGSDSFVIAQRMVSVGEMVHLQGNNGTSLFRLVIADPLKLQATVPERHLSEVKVGQQVRLNVEAYPGKQFMGQVSRVNPTVDRTSRTFQIEVGIRNAERLLNAGSFAKGSIVVQKETPILTVPEEAILNFAGVIKVFVMRQGVAEGVGIKVGEKLVIHEQPHSRTWVEVIGELKANDQIITTGHTQLAEKTPVQIRTSAPTRPERK